MSFFYHKPSFVVWPVPNRTAKSREELIRRIKAGSPRITDAMACEAIDRRDATRQVLTHRAREARLEAYCNDPDAF